jgi:hypothetical protein
MAQALDMSAEEIKELVLRLPPDELLKIAAAIDARAETIEMMQLAESGFREWNEAGEDLYDAES